jgi:hypothetical protein
MDTVLVRRRAKAHSYSLGLFAVAFCVMPIDDAMARRAIPNTYLTYPVFITLKTAETSTNGCGFYVNAEHATYLVTTRQVLAAGLVPVDSTSQKLRDAELQLSSYSKDLPLRKRIVLAANLPILQKNGDVKLHQSQDLVVIRLATAGPAASGKALQQGVAMKESTETDLLGVPTAAVKTYEQVAVGDDVILYGYPGSRGIPNSPQLDPSRPLLRRGLVAGRDPQKRSIIVDGGDRGNDGCPVFEIDPEGYGYSLIGVVIDRLDSGYSIVKPMDFVLELMN